jgi:hypothetical protein
VSSKVELADWEKRFSLFLERVMATAATNGDPRPLQEELKLLMASKPQSRKDKKHGNAKS